MQVCAIRGPPMTTRSLLLLPGDGIGPEVMAEVERLVPFFNKKGKVQFHVDTALVGGASIDQSGTPLTDETLGKARAAGAIIFGAVGGPKWEIGRASCRERVEIAVVDEADRENYR